MSYKADEPMIADDRISVVPNGCAVIFVSVINEPVVLKCDS